MKARRTAVQSNSGITRDEWMAALGAAATASEPDALTVQEIAEMFDMSTIMAYRRVREMVADGRARATFKRIETRSSGYRRVTAYVLVK